MSDEERQQIKREIERLRYIADNQPGAAAEHGMYAGWLDRLLAADAKLSRLSELNEEDYNCDRRTVR